MNYECGDRAWCTKTWKFNAKLVVLKVVESIFTQAIYFKHFSCPAQSSTSFNSCLISSLIRFKVKLKKNLRRLWILPVPLSKNPSSKIVTLNQRKNFFKKLLSNETVVFSSCLFKNNISKKKNSKIDKKSIYLCTLNSNINKKKKLKTKNNFK